MLLHDLAGIGVIAVARLLRRVPQELRMSGQDLPAPRTVTVETSQGPVTCMIYRPCAAGDSVPVLVNLHGGGYLLRQPEQDDHICRHLAAEAGCVVINVDYDTAPRRRFPVPVFEAYDVCRWAVDAGAEHGWDGTRLAVGGHSAGGALATAVCRIARDRGEFAPVLQIIDYAPLDLVTEPGDKHARTRRPLISPPLARVFNAVYVPDRSRRDDPLASPGLATDLVGLPPALVITAEYDLLRDEGDRYAAALAVAGVPVTHHMVEGVDHAFTHSGPVAAARQALDFMADHLRDTFALQQ